MVVRGRLLLVHRLHMLDMVVPALPLQRNARLVPSVRDGGDHRSLAGPARSEAEKGGASRQAPGRLRSRNRHRRPRALGGPPVRRWTVQEEALGRYVWGIVQEVTNS